MADVHIRNVPQALLDTGSLATTAGNIRNSKEALDRLTNQQLATAAGAAKEEYLNLFRQYIAAVEASIQVRENLARQVNKIINDNHLRDLADASMFRGAGGATPASH